jgi:cytochrome c
MISTNATIRLLAGAALLAGLSACGGDKPAETTETTGVETAAAEPAPAEATAPAEAPAEAAPAAEAVTFASLTGDAAKGEKVFAQCKACHVAEAGVNRVGPSLWAVIGRTAGSIEGFRYSKANQNSGLVWSEEQLFTYLEAPQRTIPGTIMAFGGLKNPQDRADVIAYLKTKA